MARIIKMSGSVKLRWIIGAGLLAGALLLLAIAAHVPGFAQWYAITVYPVYVGSLGRLTGLVLFSVVCPGMRDQLSPHILCRRDRVRHGRVYG